jgi:superfamily II DNA or RNA helicase
MATLKSLKLKSEYRSDVDNLGRDFFVPCLQASGVYSRATGYFSSFVLLSLIRGLKSFVASGGKIYLVCSPVLRAGDAEAITHGYDQRETLCHNRLLEMLEAEIEGVPELANKCQKLLSWLIANGVIEVKIAVQVDGQSGIFHEKIGVFKDASKDYISFSGSANETHQALNRNFEQIDVYCSWDSGDASRAEGKLRHFHSLWANQTKGLRVIPFPEATRQKLIETYPPGDSQIDQLCDEVDSYLRSATVTQATSQCSLPFPLREYQKEAVSAWMQNGGKGILQMATGTGKTFTAIQCALELAKRENQPLSVITLCPYIHLANSWVKSFQDCGFSTVACFGGLSNWKDLVKRHLSYRRFGSKNMPLAIVSTNSTFQGKYFQSLLDSMKAHSVLLIADEMHNLGSDNLRKLLPEQINYRLGLSATPDRLYDPDGNESLKDYFNDIVFHYGLKAALRDGHLTPYYYHIVPIHLTEAEKVEYYELTRKISRLSFTMAEDRKQDNPLALLLIKRARLIAKASNKLPALVEVLKQNLKTTHNIIYTGDGVYEEKTDGEDKPQTRYIETVIRTLVDELTLKVARFTCDESLEEREDVIDSFNKAAISHITAIRCLDEGIDIPSIQNAYILASTSNPRQHIQRRGRILRLFPGKKYSTIYDFVVLPDLQAIDFLGADVFKTERVMLRRELGRVFEFASLALNADSSLEPFLDYIDYFDLQGLIDEQEA